MLRGELGADHPEVARAKTKLATVLRAKGDFAAAEAVLQEVLATRRAAYGDEHPAVARDVNNIGSVH